MEASPAAPCLRSRPHLHSWQAAEVGPLQRPCRLEVPALPSLVRCLFCSKLLLPTESVEVALRMAPAARSSTMWPRTVAVDLCPLRLAGCSPSSNSSCSPTRVVRACGLRLKRLRLRLLFLPLLPLYPCQLHTLSPKLAKPA